MTNNMKNVLNKIFNYPEGIFSDKCDEGFSPEDLFFNNCLNKTIPVEPI
jgi:hypothetical protein